MAKHTERDFFELWQEFVDLRREDNASTVVDLVAALLSMTMYSNVPWKFGLLAKTRAALPALPIVAGGQGLTAGVTDALDQWYRNSLVKYDSILDNDN